MTSHEFDRSKLYTYALAGVAECWLVLAPEQAIEVYRNPQHGSYAEREVYERGAVVTSAVTPEFRLAVAELFGR